MVTESPFANVFSDFIFSFLAQVKPSVRIARFLEDMAGFAMVLIWRWFCCGLQDWSL